MAKRYIPAAILEYLLERKGGAPTAGARELSDYVAEPRPTVNLHLARMVREGILIREGAGPATRYRLADSAVSLGRPPAKETGSASPAQTPVPSAHGALVWSDAAQRLRSALQAPLGTRTPVTYHRQFVDDYRPNETSLLPRDLATTLHEEGRMKGQQPAGTYARRVLEQLLIDLSWYSSRLEGNRKTLLDTRELFLRGRSAGDDIDATMLLNHKDAIEFLVDAVPIYGITPAVVRNVQSLLMNGLLDDPAALGATRQTIVNISDTTYVPAQVPALLDEMLAAIIERARAVRNPVECAFFLWVNLAYLQPFQDGNKRTSRLCANLPLLLMNCAPLAFLDVDREDYALAVLGIYERQDVTLAAELFAWTYRRSIAKYRAVLEAMGLPNPFRARYREQLGETVRRIVADGVTLSAVLDDLALPHEDRAPFEQLVRVELASLAPYNCARYRLTIPRTENWIARGRPA
jgi:fido (protein-threonine AMPylation protein)